MRGTISNVRLNNVKRGRVTTRVMVEGPSENGNAKGDVSQLKCFQTFKTS